MNAKDTPVIVLGRNYSQALGVIRSLGTAGYTVDYIASSNRAGEFKVASSSKYVHKATEVVCKNIKHNMESGNPIVQQIMEYAGKYENKPVLFPTDDYTASVVDMNRELLAPHFMMPHVDGDKASMLAYMDKKLQADLAQEAGLLIPKQWKISLSQLEHDDIYIYIYIYGNLPEDIVYPCFVKPADSYRGYKKEIAVCKDREELAKHLEKLYRIAPDRSVLIQEYLKIDKEIDMSGVCIDQQVVIPAVIEKLSISRHGRGVTLQGKMLPPESIGDVLQKIIRFLKMIHYTGMFDLELNVVGDKIYFNELNLRCGSPHYSYFACGVNLPQLAVMGLLGEDSSSQEKTISEYGKIFVCEKYLYDDYAHGYLSKGDVDEMISNSDITLIFNDHDPKPKHAFLFRTKLSQTKQTLKRIVKNYVLNPRGTLKPLILGYPQIHKANQRKANAEKPRILILGRNYTVNLCMARAFGMAGYETEVLSVHKRKQKLFHPLGVLNPDAYSKYIKAYHRLVLEENYNRLTDKLIKLADPHHKMLLVPADDLVVSLVDENLDALREYYHIPNVDNRVGAIERLMDKELQSKLAEAAGLPTIKGCVISTHNREFTIPDSVSFPCFIKPDISKDGAKTRMSKCENKKELCQALKRILEKGDVQMLVEEFVDIANEYSVLGLSTKHGVIAPGFFRADEGGHDGRRGVAISGTVLPASEQQELIDKIIRFVESLNYEGLFDVDLIESTDGKMYFVELNLRYGGSGFAIVESGANLPGMFADYMLMNKAVKAENAVIEPGKTFVNEKIVMEEYMYAFLDKKEMKEKLLSSDIHFISNSDDPKAYRHFKFFFPIITLLRSYYINKKKLLNKLGKGN